MKARQNNSLKIGVLHRVAEITSFNDEDRTVDLAFSSEFPVERWFGIEILDHQKSSVDLAWLQSGRAPLLADHDPTKQIGVIESGEIGNRVGRAKVRFGKSDAADSYFQDVKDGIRKNVSFGYRIRKMILESQENDIDTYRVVEWEPLEISLVSIPADPSVGIGRGQTGEERDIEIINHLTRDKPMTTPQENPAPAAPAPAAPVHVDVEKLRADTRAAETKRINDIYALGDQHGQRDSASQFVAEGKSADEFRAFILSQIRQPKPISTDSGKEGIGLNEREARSFSINRLISAHLSGDWRHAGFEREVCEAARDKYSRQGRKFSGTFQIPIEVLAAQRSASQRDLNVANSAQGGYMVSHDHRTDSFIDLLRNKMLVRQLGATVLTGLEGNVSVPKKTSAAAAYWVTEGNAPTESQPGLGQVALTPKTVGAYTDLTRKFLLQSAVDAELFVRNELASVIALAIDRAALRGSGVGAEPLGVQNVTGIGAVQITTHTFTFAKIVDLESEVAADNADLGALAYLACAADRGRMKQQTKDTGSGQFVWADSGQPGIGMVNGYPAYATNQLAEDTVLFGNWQDLMIGEWGVLDLLIDPYTFSTTGTVRITALQDVDVAVRRAESFAKTYV